MRGFFRYLAHLLGAFLGAWGVPILIGLPLAGLIIALGPRGHLVIFGATGVFFAILGWVVSERRALAARVALGGAFGVYGAGWPLALLLVHQGAFAGSPLVWHTIRVVCVSPALAGLLALAVAWGRLRRNAASYAGVALGLVCGLPSAWLHAPWSGISLVIGLAIVLVASRLAPAPPLGDLERSARPAVWIDSWGVRHAPPAAPAEGVAWEWLVAVSVRASSNHGIGPEWELEGTSTRVRVPVPCTMELLARFARIPGFDLDAAMAAISLRADTVVPCWRGEPGEAVVCAGGG